MCVCPFILLHNFKKYKSKSLVFFIVLSNYSSFAGAPTGQTEAHVPHSMHFDASISYFDSPSFMHCTGHAAAQQPHLIHLSLILYAIIFTTFLNIFYIKHHHHLMNCFFRTCPFFQVFQVLVFLPC